MKFTRLFYNNRANMSIVKMETPRYECGNIASGRGPAARDAHVFCARRAPPGSEAPPRARSIRQARRERPARMEPPPRAALPRQRDILSDNILNGIALIQFIQK